jgi:hypothetical protein
MPSDNINMLQTVARGLGDLRDEMVFVGGAVAELYADDPLHQISGRHKMSIVR